MPLDPAQQQKVKDWIAAKGIRLNCPICSTNNWTPGDIIASPVMRAWRRSAGRRSGYSYGSAYV